MTVINLGNLKFTWKGEWAPSTAYNKDDIVKYGPSVYVCVDAHTSASAFVNNSAKFEVMAEGLESAGTWNQSTLYKKGQTVTYGGAVYVCLQEHTNINPYDNVSYWAKFVDGQQFEGNYSVSANYQKGDIVYYGGYLYVAKQNSLNNNPTNTTYWDVYSKGYEWRGPWDPALVQYRPGDVVEYGGNRYVVKQGKRPLGVRPTETSDWQQILSGFKWQGAWVSATEYLPGDIVKYGSYVYLCTAAIKGQRPDQTANFTLFTSGLSYKGVWDANTDYSLGDITKLGGRTYICVESYENDGSTSTEPPTSQYWEVFTEGFNWKGAYNASTEYEYGDVVEYSGSSFICIDNDIISVTPGTDPSKWELMSQGDISSPMTTTGDMIYRNASGNIERLPIGPSGAFLSVNNGIPSWGHLTPQNDYYVSPQGSDSNDGRTPTNSWRTLQHAAQQTFSLGQCRINVSAGTYEELCPIRVGRGVVMEGNGLGAVTLSPDTTNDKGYGVGISKDGSTPNANSEVFQMNNGARLRNFVFRNFSTGSVQVSLDPGNGPDDTSVWISSQSPYVQNCTNFSPGGTGFKVDGALHNGGYKSMVANDFTQINSDGVGVHVLNDGRTEIVSCFTYYCNNGYLAESGGKIRAIVGNNSYGEYGAVARGYSQTETPLTGKLRLNTQTINSVQTLGSNVHVFTSYRDSVGNRFFVGHTDPTGTDVTSSWDNTASYPFVAKFNSAGSLDWIYTYESSFGAIHSAVELSDRIYCGGVIYDATNKGFILSISKAGEIQWQKTIGDTTEISDLTTDGNNLYAVGTHSTTGSSIIKLNPAGVESWAKTLEYNDSSAANTLVATSCAFAATPTTSTDTYALAGDATAENNLYVASYDSTANQSVITRFNSSGDYVASYIYGDVRINSLRLDTGNGDGIYLVAGGYYDPAGAVTQKALIARISVNGNVAWQKQLDFGSENGEIKDVLPFGNDVYACGYVNEGTNNNNTGLLTRLTSTGNIDWTVKLDNGTNNISLNGVMLDGVNVVTAGIEQGNSVIFSYQRDRSGGLGTITSGSYAQSLLNPTVESSTVVQKQIEEMSSGTVILGSSDTTLTLNQTPTQTRSIAGTRSGFAGIGRGTSFSVDSLSRLPKDGSVLQILGDSETYFVISVANYIAPTYTTGNNPNAQAILTANKTFLQEEVIAWINVQISGGAGIWSGFTYNSDTCKRDVGLIVDALVTDLDYNSNGNTVDAAISYYRNASGLFSIQNEKDQTVATWTYVKSIIDDILNQSAITPSSGNSIIQTTGLTATEAGAVTLAENNVQALVDAFNGGLNSLPAKTNYGTATIGIDPPIPSNKTPGDLTHITFREAFSQVRMSGHDFLDIGTGGFADTNYPVIIASDYQQQPDQGRETLSQDGGRVFYVTTDQDGNFRVGDYFKVEQATGRATLSSEEFDLAGLNELQLGSITAGKQGATINEFSTDGTFADNSDSAVPTEKAVKTYVDGKVAGASAIIAGSSPNQSKVSVTGSGASTDTIDFDIAGTTIAQIGSQYQLVPKGSTANRPGSPVSGYIRFNTDVNALEIYQGTAWVPAGGLSNVNISDTDSPYTASAFQMLWIDTTSGAVTVTLPASAQQGDEIRFLDVTGNFGSNELTVARNGHAIQGQSSTDLTVNTNRAGFSLVYYNVAQGWLLKDR